MTRVPSDAHLALLACPHCGGELSASQRTVACANGHTFDVARQGYVSLFAEPSPLTGDTIEMIAARERIERAGLLAPLVDLVSGVVRLVAPSAGADTAPVVVDAGGGTGHVLSAVVDSMRPHLVRGLVIDLSAPAVRRAARRSEAIAAVRSDLRARWPVRDAVVDVVLDVFAPRNPKETRRVLLPDGVLVVVVPLATHLQELVEPMGLVVVDPEKTSRLERALDADFEQIGQRETSTVVPVGRDQAIDLVAMGPSAAHADRERIAALLAPASPSSVTLAYCCRWYRPRPSPADRPTAS